MKIHFNIMFLASTYFACSYSVAAGMIPETSVLLIDADKGEGTINVTNSDNHAALLHTSIENTLDDNEELLIVTSPISRVEGGQRQLVRFIINPDSLITTQRLKRVIFEGIPPKNTHENPKVSMGIRQNIPAIISPVGLPEKNDPWTLLKWHVENNILTVSNESPYVVRLSQEVKLIPSETQLTLPAPYILPGQRKSISIPVTNTPTEDSIVRTYPASIYGYQVSFYDAPLSR